MTVKKYLETARDIDIILESKKRQLEDINNIKMFFDSRMKLSKKKYDKGTKNLRTLEKEFLNCVEDWTKIKLEAHRIINSVDNITYRTLLSLRYERGLTWDMVCDEMNYTWKWIHVLHRRALECIDMDIDIR